MMTKTVMFVIGLTGCHMKGFSAIFGAFIFLVAVSLAVGQPMGYPAPKDVNDLVRDNSRSEKYKGINYFVNGIKAPGRYSGPQEGGPPDPKAAEKMFNGNISRLDESIQNEPNDPVLYEYRGSSYLELFKITEDVNDRAAYAERALRDLNRSIEIDPEHWQSFEIRARLLKLIDFFKYFDLIVSDQLEAIRILPKILAKYPNSPDSYRFRANELYSTISSQYRDRARLLSSYPDLLSEVQRHHKEYSNYSYMNDFDLALEYCQQKYSKPI